MTVKENVFELKQFISMKELIRIAHISYPQYIV